MCHARGAGYRQAMPQRYDDYDRVAVVTGSDSGIGEAVAVALARAGFDVGVTFRSDAAGAASTAAKVRELDRRCEVRRLDLTDLPAAADVVDELAEAGWAFSSTTQALARGSGWSTRRTSNGARSSRSTSTARSCVPSAPPAG